VAEMPCEARPGYIGGALLCQTQAIWEEDVECRRAETSTTADSASAGATRPRFLCLAHTVEKFPN
jgi:hypothetical protein